MTRADLLLKNGTIVTSDGFFKGNIVVNDGRITAIDQGNCYQGNIEIDAGEKYILPGGVDPHVHIREPGRPDRETFQTGTMAAAAGGVTTILEHPISEPPPYNGDILSNRKAVAKPQAFVDYAFYGAASAKHRHEIGPLAEQGIAAFKTFLHEPPPGREIEFEGLTMGHDSEILEGFQAISQTGFMCAVHAENNAIIQANIRKLKDQNRRDGMAHPASRPPITEIETVSKILLFAKETGTPVEFCHISTPEAMAMIRTAKSEGQQVYLETCPHYLFLDHSLMDTQGPYVKFNPPLRSEASRDKLWDYIHDGTVDFIGSDHSPFLLKEKEAGTTDIFAAPPGLPSLELRLPLMLNAVHEGKLTLPKVVELLSENTAKIFNLYPQKGAVQVGSDADFVIVDLDAPWTIDISKMYTKARDILKLFNGWAVTGKPVTTILRGRIVMENQQVDPSAEGWGKLLI